MKNKVMCFMYFFSLFLVSCFNTVEPIPDENGKGKEDEVVCFDYSLSDICKDLEIPSDLSATNFVIDFSDMYQNTISCENTVFYVKDSSTNTINALRIEGNGKGKIIINSFSSGTLSFFVKGVQDEVTEIILKNNEQIKTEKNGILSILNSEIQILSYDIQEGRTEFSVSENIDILVYRILLK